jgi:hypothetical protein
VAAAALVRGDDGLPPRTGLQGAVRPFDVDARAGALVGGIDDPVDERERHRHLGARSRSQLTVRVLDVRQTVYIELEDRGCELRAQAVAGAGVLIDTDP